MCSAVFGTPIEVNGGEPHRHGHLSIQSSINGVPVPEIDLGSTPGTSMYQTFMAGPVEMPQMSKIGMPLGACAS